MERQQLTQAESRRTENRSANVASQSARAHPFLQLQQSIGNQAFGHLLQAKLKMSQPGDAFEQEADRVADQIMRMPDPAHAAPSAISGRAPAGENLQRSCARSQGQAAEECPDQQRRDQGEKDELHLYAKSAQGASGLAGGIGVEGHLTALRGSGSGRALGAAERAFFEPRFGRDLGEVRVHTGGQADEAARAAGALAFTVGRDVVFAAGQYAPDSVEGQRLLAHELAHTIQQGAGTRLSRQCAPALAAIPTPAGDSLLNADAFLDLGRVPVTPDISAGPLAGTFHVKVHVPRELQRAITPGVLGRLNIQVNASLDFRGAGARPTAASRGNELCVFVTFHREPGETGATQNWYADLRILAGGRLNAPLQIGLGGPTTLASPTAPAAGTARIQLQLTDDLKASVGPLTLETWQDVSTIWTSIQSQVREKLALGIGNIQVPLSLRTSAALTVPVPVPGGESAQTSVIPVNILGQIEMTTQATTSGDGFTIRLVGGGTGTALAGLVAVELSGRGRLRGPLPSTIRLADLSSDFLRGLLAESQGSGELRGRITAFGVPGRVHADFTMRNNRLLGDATFVSPLALGGGTFRYGLDEGLSADLGIVGLTRLAIAPPPQRLPWEPERSFGQQPYDFGTSVTGLGVTGVHITPTLTHMLSVGAGPQFITTPTNESITAAYGGLTYTLQFPGL